MFDTSSFTRLIKGDNGDATNSDLTKFCRSLRWPLHSYYIGSCILVLNLYLFYKDVAHLPIIQVNLSLFPTFSHLHDVSMQIFKDETMDTADQRTTILQLVNTLCPLWWYPIAL